MRYIIILVLVFGIADNFAQTQDTTKGSIPSQAELMLGKIGVRIQYYAPAVRGRIIWGGLIAYDQVWVTGAHRATTLEVNTSVEIGGQTLKPGKYALFTIPGKEQWTIILNKNWDQHLADEYNQAEDVIRFTVTLQAVSLRERLKYSLEKENDSEVKATIHWEKIAVSFPIKILSTKSKYKLQKSKGPGLTTTTTHDHGMSHAFSLSLPMNRNGSGTGWLPDNTPMYAWMKPGQNWSFMWHGGLFIRQNWQNINNDYKAGGKQFDAPGWAMGMAQRKIGQNGLLLLRSMISIDPITVGGDGYPLLFQSGETYKGEPLVNRQHPHDFFSELSIGYTHRISQDADLNFYLGYPGEPSIGPTAFMHRISSMNNPEAPLGHHWQDATHITFGVATVGLRYKKFKLEGSSFTGREPNEDRYNFDKPRFDSYSSRLSFAPIKQLTMQASYAYLKSPEELEPDENVKRTTASLIYSNIPSGEKLLTAAFVWGFNDSGGDHQENSILIEGNYQLFKWALYSRYEWVEKSAEELQLTAFEDEIFSINGFTLGVNYRIGSWLKTDIALGIQGTMNFIPASLETVYGQTPLSAETYLRIVPRLMAM